MLIFKRKRASRGGVHKEAKKAENDSDGMIYSAQENSWMEETLMLEWIEKVWKPFTEKCLGHFLLLFDQFAECMTQKVQDIIAACFNYSFLWAA